MYVPSSRHFEALLSYKNKYDNINFLFDAPLEENYQEYGRYQTWDEAVEVHNELVRYLVAKNIDFVKVTWDNVYDTLINILKDETNKEK